MNLEGEYIEFIEGPPKPKTRTWGVWNKGQRLRMGEFPIGHVQWYGPWRQYTFQWACLSVLSAGCLREIANFCEARTLEHREHNAAEVTT